MRESLLALMLTSSLVACATSAEVRKKRAVVIIYDGYGTATRARVWGRVLEDKGLDIPKTKEGRWTRLKRTYRLLESDEIPRARVVLRVGGRRYLRCADAEGFFSLDVVGLKAGRHRVGATLPAYRGLSRVIGGEIAVAPKKGGIAIISDIDDTILVTGVGNKVKMAWKVLFANARRLKTYRHASALYRALVARGAPLVFVSGSPINLYPRLRLFFTLRGFPRGSLRLKNFGVHKGSDSLFGQKSFKLKRLREALALLPAYRFILIGDSGEKDPEIYHTFRVWHPKKVAATLIHNVSGPQGKTPRFKGQFIFDDYLDAARYLRRRGLLGEAEVLSVKTSP